MKNQKKLSDTLTIRGHVIKNRICVPPMHVGSNADEHGMATGRGVEHYRAFAAGGAGLIIQEATCVLPDGLLTPIQIGCWSDEQIPGLARIADAVHKENGVIVAQIHHAGATGVCEEVVSPSEYTVRESGKTARALTTEEVGNMINAFVSAAVRIHKAGYDGVELHGCHSYLTSQFFNRRVNKRSDIYADPMEFVGPIIRKIREQVSEDFIIGIRLGAFEPTLEWRMGLPMQRHWMRQELILLMYPTGSAMKRIPAALKAGRNIRILSGQRGRLKNRYPCLCLQ